MKQWRSSFDFYQKLKKKQKQLQQKLFMIFTCENKQFVDPLMAGS